MGGGGGRGGSGGMGGWRRRRNGRRRSPRRGGADAKGGDGAARLGETLAAQRVLTISHKDPELVVRDLNGRVAHLLHGRPQGRGGARGGHGEDPGEVEGPVGRRRHEGRQAGDHGDVRARGRRRAPLPDDEGRGRSRVVLVPEGLRRAARARPAGRALRRARAGALKPPAPLLLFFAVRSSAVGVAQSVERRIVVPNVAGSTPVSHPSFSAPDAPVAQLDRASDSGSEGQAFESPRAHHFLLRPQKQREIVEGCWTTSRQVVKRSPGRA